jgi:hypothetical protein
VVLITLLQCRQVLSVVLIQLLVRRYHLLSLYLPLLGTGTR